MKVNDLKSLFETGKTIEIKMKENPESNKTVKARIVQVEDFFNDVLFSVENEKGEVSIVTVQQNQDVPFNLINVPYLFYNYIKFNEGRKVKISYVNFLENTIMDLVKK